MTILSTRQPALSCWLRMGQALQCLGLTGSSAMPTMGASSKCRKSKQRMSRSPSVLAARRKFVRLSGTFLVSSISACLSHPRSLPGGGRCGPDYRVMRQGGFCLQIGTVLTVLRCYPCRVWTRHVRVPFNGLSLPAEVVFLTGLRLLQNLTAAPRMIFPRNLSSGTSGNLPNYV